jgi:predicted peroxiredoxin
MSKRYFVMISTDPDVDPAKCIIGMICAAQAASERHDVNVFFAGMAVKLLQAEYIAGLDGRAGYPAGTARPALDSLIQRATIHCSTRSQGVVGVNPENAQEILVGGYDLNWSGPAGVVALSSDSEVNLSF